jgi:hypothetical protein
VASRSVSCDGGGAMIAISSINQEISEAVQKLDMQCNNIQSGLLFCDAFAAKLPSGDVNAETEFWYAVTNLYGLFFDCAPYVFHSHTQFARKIYADPKPVTLLEILLKNACLSEDDKEEIESFIYAIQELRHAFCHNMPPAEFDHLKIIKAFGSQLEHWYVFPYLLTSGGDPFDYEKGLCVLRQHMVSIFIKLAAAVSNLECIITDEQRIEEAEIIVNDWYRAVICWYMQSDEVLHRCLNVYYDLHDDFHCRRKYSQVKEWKTKLPDYVDSISNAFGETRTDYLRNWINDLVDIASTSHAKATADTIMSEFFDEVLS